MSQKRTSGWLAGFSGADKLTDNLEPGDRYCAAFPTVAVGIIYRFDTFLV